MSCWCFHLNKLEVKYSTGCFQKSGGKLPPKMDGENSGSKPYEQMDDLGGKPPPLFLVQHPTVRTIEIYSSNRQVHWIFSKVEAKISN